MNQQARFWNHVQKTESCWPWIGARHRNGYGAMNYSGRIMRVHRISWLINNGAIPEGKQILHTCDNPLCVNPDHLFVGTNSDNMADKVRKGRQAKGENQGSSKLQENSVREIRQKYQQGISQRELAKQYNVSTPAISQIVTKKCWGWLGV